MSANGTVDRQWGWSPSTLSSQRPRGRLITRASNGCRSEGGGSFLGRSATLARLIQYAYPRTVAFICAMVGGAWGGGGWGAHEGGVSPHGDAACLPVSSSACFLSRWSRGLGCALNQESGRAGKHPVLEGFWYAPSVVSNHEMGDVG